MGTANNITGKPEQGFLFAKRKLTFPILCNKQKRYQRKAPIKKTPTNQTNNLLINLLLRVINRKDKMRNRIVISI